MCFCLSSNLPKPFFAFLAAWRDIFLCRVQVGIVRFPWNTVVNLGKKIPVSVDSAALYAYIPGIRYNVKYA